VSSDGLDGPIGRKPERRKRVLHRDVEWLAATGVDHVLGSEEVARRKRDFVGPGIAAVLSAIHHAGSTQTNVWDDLGAP
jgi:hypothetical protein